MADQIDQQRFAVLVDGDNVQASLLAQILAEISRSGLITNPISAADSGLKIATEEQLG
ncbi:hypothetical protein KJ564_14070 [bacterium]|nr:hypothetical protein [bacterium]MBU1881857.1 hypothetical protein [bacterium]